jgi:hypothetical protein
VQSSGQAAVAKKVGEVEAGTFRHQVLLTAQKFKSSWVELGAQLVKVRSGKSFEEWGFQSFEEYCSKELRIKKATADKLTMSYSFLSRHERPMAERFRAEPPVEKEAPAFEVVSVLAGAEERGQLTEKDYLSLREQLWSDERPANQVARELAQKFPPPAKPPPPADLVVRRLAQAARKLASDLRGCSKIPDAVAARAEALAEDVEELASKQKE